ncbi:hypothetical protein, partial [Lachnospira eligens]|uniref:hypothetical protein n=1 Tax=Lachnospira eligens TaxID=39485 RepID=UPI001A9A66D0
SIILIMLQIKENEIIMLQIKENEIIILAVSGKSQMDILCNMSQELLQRTMVITDDIRQGLK